MKDGDLKIKNQDLVVSNKSELELMEKEKEKERGSEEMSQTLKMNVI